MNKKIKTIIIDDNQHLVDELKSHFLMSNTIEISNTFNNGNDALKYVTNYKNSVDLILMELLLPGLDGISFLEELKKINMNTKIIVLSKYNDENIVQKCINLKVSYFILKPINISSLENRINDCFNKMETYKREKESLDIEISQILHNLGIPSHIKGYKYIRDSINYIYNKNFQALITKDIYPHIAIKYETTPSRVERAIRHAIEVSCIRGDLNFMEELFGFSISCDKSRPTNSEFISTIADKLKLENVSYSVN